MANGGARKPRGMGLALFQIWRRCWAGEQGGQEGQEGQRIRDSCDRVDDCDTCCTRPVDAGTALDKPPGCVVSSQKGRGGVEGGQVRAWPPSRNPRRCLKAAKMANVFVTLLTLLMNSAPALGLWKWIRGLIGSEGGYPLVGRLPDVARVLGGGQ